VTTVLDSTTFSAWPRPVPGAGRRALTSTWPSHAGPTPSWRSGSAATRLIDNHPLDTTFPGW